jgi:hypothetical protein
VSESITIDELIRTRAVLIEFINDVEAAGVKSLEIDWPDLVITYRKAKALL